MTYREALEQIATGRGTGLTAAENLDVCRTIAREALDRPVCGDREYRLRKILTLLRHDGRDAVPAVAEAVEEIDKLYSGRMAPSVEEPNHAR
jgi:hypothetical protein